MVHDGNDIETPAVRPVPSTDEGLSDQPDDGLFIIGVGASAGGLEALRQLFAEAPRDIPAIYVVVQHMSPNHRSLLRALIDRETHLTVAKIHDGIEPRANVVYVAPPGYDIVYARERLQLRRPPANTVGPRPSVDRFFRSIADGVGSRSIGIVLSGTGSDGAQGVRAIREVGGLTIAQDTDTARYAGMPLAAVQTDAVDLVLPPDEIAARLGRLPDMLGTRAPSAWQDTAPTLSNLLELLRARAGTDFTKYKEATVRRRIERRMAACETPSLADYVGLCAETPAELDRLFKDLLISVTRFFRDAEEFSALRPHLQGMVASSTHRPLRVWVPGCATGEEAYSVAMLMAEELGGREAVGKNLLQIFATDLDRDALHYARQGRYPVDALHDIPAGLAARYTVPDGDHAKMSRTLRELIMFTPHDVTRDAPFMRIDLVSCRNLLIYFKTSLQERVLTRLHYALRPEGLLMLGPSEGVEASPSLFRSVPRASNLYERRPIRDVSYGHLVVEPGPPTPNLPDPAIEPATGASLTDFDLLARKLGNGALLFDAALNILRVFGAVERYITLADGGRPTLDANILVTPLAAEAQSLVLAAIGSGERQQGLPRYLHDNDAHLTVLEAIPILQDHAKPRALLIFHSRALPGADDAAAADRAADDAKFDVLRRELAHTSENLRTTIADLQRSNAQLLASSAEAEARNHQLLALNEELQTANEELSSANVELVTVNEELKITAHELSALKTEQAVLLTWIDVPVLVIGMTLHIRRWSQAAAAFFEIETTAGRPHLSQCIVPTQFPPLTEIAEAAILECAPVEREASTDRAAYRLICAPLVNGAGEIDGVVLVATEAKDASRLAAELHDFLRNAPVEVMRLDADGNIRRIAERLAGRLGTTAEAAEGAHLRDVVAAPLADTLLADNGAFAAGDLTRDTSVLEVPLGEAGGIVSLELEHSRSGAAHGSPGTIYTAVRDVTATRALDANVRALRRQLDMAQRLSGIAFWSIDLARDQLFWSDRVYEIHGVTRQEYTPEVASAVSFYHPDDRTDVVERVERAISLGEGFEFQARVVRPDGTVVPVHARCDVECDDDGKVVRVFGVFAERP